MVDAVIYHGLSEQYFAGHFLYTDSIAARIPRERFDRIQAQFHLLFDDWYRDYYLKYGSQVEPVKALIRTAFALYGAAYGHLPKAYKNCAISSGTTAHLDAVARHHHTSDRMARLTGSDRHTRVIKDNSQRSLERVAQIKDLFPEVFVVAPALFEGSTRAYSKGEGRELTGGLPIDAADYMSFWNMVIDGCEAFILDDPALDAPPAAQVRREIEAAQTGSPAPAPRPVLRTSDWSHSRNSILEMARGNYIRFGLHPLRPDAKMDMRFYDEKTHRLYPATLLDCIKPVLRNIARWVPQGIAADEAVRTACRLIHLHRMRTDSAYNEAQIAPLDLSSLDPLVADPTHAEVREFERLIAAAEPFLFKYCAHLMKTDGLPPGYEAARLSHPLGARDIGPVSRDWQRAHVPADEAMALWDLAQPAERNPAQACALPVPSHRYAPPRRLHDFQRPAFSRQEEEIWPDEPFAALDRMSQQLAQAHIGVLEIVSWNAERPDYPGLRYDLKRGAFALDTAHDEGLADLSLLPGRLGAGFAARVKAPSLRRASTLLDGLRRQGDPPGPVPAFGSPVVAAADAAVRRERKNFPGPGPVSPPPGYRLALEMEMLRRNYTSLTFQKNWEVSEDGARMMIQATKIEFGKIRRPGGNDTALRVLDENGSVISFYERYRLLDTYLSVLRTDSAIRRAVDERDSAALENYGIRHISLALARLVEIYDCLRDQDYNEGRFELRRVEELAAVGRDIDRIADMRAGTIAALCEHWCWLWDESDLDGLRQEYRDAWLAAHGRQAREAAAAPTDDRGIRNRYGPA